MKGMNWRKSLRDVFAPDVLVVLLAEETSGSWRTQLAEGATGLPGSVQVLVPAAILRRLDVQDQQVVARGGFAALVRARRRDRGRRRRW